MHFLVCDERLFKVVKRTLHWVRFLGVTSDEGGGG